MNPADRTILIADTSLKGALAQGWCSTLAAFAPTFWPEGRTPRCEVVAAQWLLTQMERADFDTLKPAALLLVSDDATSAAFIDRFMQAMMVNGLSGVLLVKDHEAWRAHQRDGVLFEPPDAALPKVAALMYALSERQEAVRVLSAEVTLANRCQEGVRLAMERLHEELNLAASMQREFTSAPLPEIDGLEFSVLFRPVNFVSGDVYAIRPIDDDHLGFLIADAVGHGVPAALLTMVLANSLAGLDRNAPGARGVVRDPMTEGALARLSPAQVLRTLNSRLCEVQGENARFATAVYGVINRRTLEVRIAGAGHPYPIVVGRETQEEIVTEGPLLGVFPDAEFTEATFTLNAGESLVLYTDGLEAAFDHPDNPPPAARNGHLAALLESVRNRSTTSPLASRLSSLVDGQSGSLHQADDVTVLAIAVPGSTAESRKAA